MAFTLRGSRFVETRKVALPSEGRGAASICGWSLGGEEGKEVGVKEVNPSEIQGKGGRVSVGAPGICAGAVDVGRRMEEGGWQNFPFPVVYLVHLRVTRQCLEGCVTSKWTRGWSVMKNAVENQSRDQTVLLILSTKSDLLKVLNLHHVMP